MHTIRPKEAFMLETSDPIRLVGRTVDVRTVSGSEYTGTLCSAGLGGVIIDVGAVRHEFGADQIARLDARSSNAPATIVQ